MKFILMIACVIAMSNAIPLNAPIAEVYSTNFNSDGPQPVDAVVPFASDNEQENSSKRVARHYGFGGVNVAVGVPVVGVGIGVPTYGYGYGGYPYYGGYGGYGGYGRYGGYGGYGYGGYGHHHHHHHGGFYY